MFVILFVSSFLIFIVFGQEGIVFINVNLFLIVIVFIFRILVVDGNIDIRRLLLVILGNVGFLMRLSFFCCCVFFNRMFIMFKLQFNFSNSYIIIQCIWYSILRRVVDFVIVFVFVILKVWLDMFYKFLVIVFVIKYYLNFRMNFV